MRVAVNIWEAVFKRDSGRCRYCGLDLLQSYSTFTSATVDHLVAKSVGGLNDVSNLVLACPGCNQMLSRSGRLTTFEERKEYVLTRQRDHAGWYQNMLGQLRNGDADT